MSYLDLHSDRVRQLGDSSPVCLEATSTVELAVARMREGHQGVVLLLRDGQLSGIFTERDALRVMAAAAAGDSGIWQRPVSELMSSPPVVVRADQTVGEAVELMSAGGFRHLPVQGQDGTPSGVLRVADILHYLVEHFPRIVYTLPPAPGHVAAEREGA